MEMPTVIVRGTELPPETLRTLCLMAATIKSQFPDMTHKEAVENAFDILLWCMKLEHEVPINIGLGEHL